MANRQRRGKRASRAQGVWGTEGPSAESIKAMARRRRPKSMGVMPTGQKAVVVSRGANPRIKLDPAFSKLPGLTGHFGSVRVDDPAPRWERHLNDVMRNHPQPEMRLAATVLVETVKDLGRPTYTRLYKDARAWVAVVGSGFFTFDDYCCELDLDADWVRADLLARAPRDTALRSVA
jgi:hypothetical protein